MKRYLMVSSILLAAGCALPPEQAPLRPLPENQQVSYQELYKRARRQAELINAACYDDQWVTMDEAAQGLQQTARYLSKASEIPPSLKNQTGRLTELEDVAQKLSKAAVAKDAKAATASLTELTNLIRKIRPPDETPPPPPARSTNP